MKHLLLKTAPSIITIKNIKKILKCKKSIPADLDPFAI